MKQIFDIGIPITDLNGRAVDAVRDIEPQTGYTQHWLRSLKRRDVVWQLTALGDLEGVNQLQEKEIAYVQKWKKQFEGMTDEEQEELLSQPISKP